MKVKKFSLQTLTIIGFCVVVLGAIISVTEKNVTAISLFTLPYIAAALACAFVISSNETVKVVGYTISTLLGVSGIQTVLASGYIPDSYVVVAIGFIVMLVPALVFAFIQLFAYFGFVRAKDVKCSCEDIATMLNQYKAMEKEEVLSAEEFAALKEKILENSTAQVADLEDLKKWKKLLDQQIITEEEFANLKAKVFNK